MNEIKMNSNHLEKKKTFRKASHSLRKTLACSDVWSEVS